jgi:LCP family protein required for cell wall assembly
LGHCVHTSSLIAPLTGGVAARRVGERPALLCVGSAPEDRNSPKDSMADQPTPPPASPRPRRRWLKIVLGVLLLLIVASASYAGYAYYKIDRFAESAFRPDDQPPQTEFGETPTPEPSVAAQATAGPTEVLPPTPTHDPRDPNTPTPIPPTSTATMVLTPTPTPLPYGNSPVIKRLQVGERISVLLVGFGGPGHDGGYLTDSLQVMTFDPKLGTVTLISIPRDLFIQIPSLNGRGGYWGRINEAYSAGMGNVDRNDTRIPYEKHEAGGQLAMKAVAQVLGIPIDYWVSMDFVGFEQFIDAIGGVDVYVEKAFTDYQYPNHDDATVDPSYRTIKFDVGMQHMDGQRAIEFARSRYSAQDGNDFSRSRRQQLLMTAVKDKLFRVETIPRLLSLLDAFEGHLRMSFSFTEAKDLLGWGQEQARADRQFTIQTGVLEVGQLLYSDTLPSGAYVIFPRAGQGVYTGIHRYVRELLDGPSNATPGTPGTPGRPTTPTPGVPVTPTGPAVTPTRQT